MDQHKSCIKISFTLLQISADLSPMEYTHLKCCLLFIRGNSTPLWNAAEML